MDAEMTVAGEKISVNLSVLPLLTGEGRRRTETPGLAADDRRHQQ